MADKKKSYKDALFTAEALAVMFLSFLMLLAVSGDGRICILGAMLSSVTASVLAASMMALIVLAIACTRKKDDGKLKEFPAIVSGIAVFFCVVCLIIGVVRDISDTKIKGELNISEEESVILTETTVKNKYTETERTHITVYLKGEGLTAKKLGEIDETMFTVKCIESGSYNCYYNSENETVTVICYHGGYGNGIASLLYDEGSMTYNFPIKYKTKSQKKHEQETE